ncbi:MAG: bi-domain-containing oxidoreductase [Rhizobiaceae bacterium]
MKQIVQHLNTGKTVIVEAPSPRAKSGSLVVDTNVSLISAGTERMLVEFSKGNLIAKARSQPEKVKQVLNKALTDGIGATLDTVRAKLGEPIPLGYSNVGRVSAVGGGVKGFKVGDRVVSNGPHASVVRVPKNLCAKIPESVSDETASFTVVTSIGLQGIRLAQPTLGECFVVTGVGLIGLMTVQLLIAQGCRVLALDFDDSKLKLAESFGAETLNPSKGADPVQAAIAFSRGVGVDGVIITASSKSNEPIKQSAQMCRVRGRVVLIGVVGLNLDRADFFDKEISFQVSCSYGPGRYDSSYEEQGHDYPIGYVRWTEQRNFEAVLDMFASGKIEAETLISHRFAFEEAANAYEVLGTDPTALGMLLNYPKADKSPKHHLALGGANSSKNLSSSDPVVGFVGAGNYASRILIPAFKAGGASLHTIATSGGLSAAIHGDSAGFDFATTDTASMLANKDINTIAIATQHNSHANFAAHALNEGKNVFVEKPLALDGKQLDAVQKAYAKAHKGGEGPRLMVGFNRRFAPQIIKIKELLEPVVEPKSFIMTVNAGAIPADHWTQDEVAGGGRIIGEACHFIDLLRFLSGSPITYYSARRMGDKGARATVEDVSVITLGFEDGSFGTIHYLANGAQNFPKERLEVFAGGAVLQLDNFRKLKGFGWPGFKRMNLSRQDKGQQACAAMFLDSIRDGSPAPISIDELFETAKVTIEIVEMLRKQQD